MASATRSRQRSSTRHKLALTAIAIVCAGALSLAHAQAANAAVYRYNIINKSSTANVTGAVFASCKITTTGGLCSISKGKSVTRTVQVSLGASRADVATGLSISSASSVTTTVGCSSPALRAGQVWKARALGTRHSYRVQKQESYRPRIGPTYWKTVGTSSVLTAYNPYSSGISCGL